MLVNITSQWHSNVEWFSETISKSVDLFARVSLRFSLCILRAPPLSITLQLSQPIIREAPAALDLICVYECAAITCALRCLWTNTECFCWLTSLQSSFTALQAGNNFCFCLDNTPPHTTHTQVSLPDAELKNTVPVIKSFQIFILGTGHCFKSWLDLFEDSRDWSAGFSLLNSFSSEADK